MHTYYLWRLHRYIYCIENICCCLFTLQNTNWSVEWNNGCVYYRVLVHFEHWLPVLRAERWQNQQKFRALKAPGWRTANGQKMQCETMDTTRVGSNCSAPSSGPELSPQAPKPELRTLFSCVSKVLAPPLVGGRGPGQLFGYRFLRLTRNLYFCISSLLFATYASIARQMSWSSQSC